MRHLTTILSSFTLLLTFVFYFRWSRDISTTPILLQNIRHSFSYHPELLNFDEDTQKRWWSQTDHEWWRTEWTDEDGRRVLMGIDMLHKIHCLVSIRDEFTALLLNGTYHYNFYDKNQIDKRLHLGHCFDLIRQVSKNGCELDCRV